MLIQKSGVGGIDSRFVLLINSGNGKERKIRMREKFKVLFLFSL